MAWRWRTFLWDFTYLCWNLTNDEKYRRRMGRELNNGEPAHDLSRFLCFGKEGVLRGREFGDQVHTFSCSRCCTMRWWPGTSSTLNQSLINCVLSARTAMTIFSA
ncbi:MAG: Tn3 family transposase [Verrucomicrobia bacterium]|nr:Tn3 family transposase [Verrucomicrobiota bacterium]